MTRLKHSSINDIFNTFDSILTRDINWLQVSKDSLIGLKYSTSTNIDNLSVTIRRAYNCAETNQIKEAIRILEEYKNLISEHETIGFLKQQIAEYTNIFNPGQAQELLLSAAQENKKLTRCINGIEFTKIVYKETSQAQKIQKFCLDNNIDPNKYIIKISALLDNLCFGSSYNAFEDAIDNLAKLLGFVGQRSELEHGKGPDNFWCVGQSNYFVIECKNQTTTELIFKDDCKQINTSIQWFSNLYNDSSLNMMPILIHNSKIFEKACSPNPDIRIMTPDFLDKLKSSLKNFAESLSNNNAFKDPFKLQGNL